MPTTWNVGNHRVHLHAGSITEVEADAIVTAANAQLAGGGGVDGAVHRAAGPELLRACQAIAADARGHRCPTGQARITPGFRLAPWVIHAVGPIYDAARPDRSAAALAAAYDTSLFLADLKMCASVAFPAISAGVYGYPLPEAATIAVDRVVRFLERDTCVADVTFALFGEASFSTFEQALTKRLG